ncbi:MAG: type II toxin-antitoxin system RelE/ParE family toxin [Polyangia bacterium]
MKRLVLAPKARADLFDIDAYLAERNPLAAERLIERLIQAMQALTRMPLMGRTCEDLGLPAVRRFVVEKHHIFMWSTARISGSCESSTADAMCRPWCGSSRGPDQGAGGLSLLVLRWPRHSGDPEFC